MPEACLYTLHALTGLHPGSGAAIADIDLPVQRERHTHWPVIPAATIKGVLRAATGRSGGATGEHHRHAAIFGQVEESSGGDGAGTEASGGSKPKRRAFAGAVSFTDARILAFPVRSLLGVFALVTCPAVLLRLKRDAELAGITALPDVPDIAQGHVRTISSRLIIRNGQSVDSMILEEFDFKVTGDAGAWPDALKTLVSPEAVDLHGHLAILANDDFVHFVKHATEVSARIALDSHSKTVKGRTLFWQEVLPPETLFYGLALANRSRDAETPMDAKEVLDWLGHHLPPYVQIGADETIGRGICRIRLAGAAGGGAS